MRSAKDRNDLLIYPNPVSDILYIDSIDKAFEDGKIIITDVLGNKLLTQTLDKKDNSLIKIDVSSYNNGIYFVSILDSLENTVKTQKVLINHNK